MAYNLASFNGTAFNSGSEGSIWINVIFAENVTPSIGTSMEVFALASGNERVNVEARMGNGLFLPSVIGTETVNEGITTGMSSIVLGLIEGYEYVSEETTIMQESYMTVSGNESVDCSLWSGGTVWCKGTGKETITGEGITDKETYLIVSGYELVSSSATLEAVDIHVCEIGITLEPGQKLIVDAINYTVKLDNENIIWAQSGEWLDELSRETSSISINASAGVANLSASILYTERYL